MDDHVLLQSSRGCPTASYPSVVGAMTTTWTVAARTHIGLVRDSHQDCIHVNGWSGTVSDASLEMELARPAVVAVIDGMGGHPGGATAARTASAALADLALDKASAVTEVNEVMQRVADTVRSVGVATEGYASMGATVAGVIVNQDSLFLFNVGDCSILRIKDGYVGQLAVIDRAERTDGRSGVVTQCLGGSPHPTSVDAHAEVFVPADDELLVLCSDGLTDVVDNAQIAVFADAASTASELAASLVAAALQAGAPDNVSVVVLQRTAEDLT